MSKIKILKEDIERMVTDCVLGISQKVISEEVNSLYESSWSRVLHWMETHDIATITAFRSELTNVTKNTYIPDGTGVGYRFSLAENRERNQKLKASLLAHHYGVTSIYGSWIEGIAGSNSREVAEESYFVVNLNDDPNFYENLFRLSEYFNQDSFLFKERGSDTAVLVGTNMSGFPVYGKQAIAGQLTSLPSKFMSRIKKAAFSFVDKSNWVVKDKREDLTDTDLQDYTHSYSWRNDKRPTFDQRKYDRMTDKEQKEIRLAEDWVRMKKNGGIVLETIDGQHPKQKDIIGKTAVK